TLRQNQRALAEVEKKLSAIDRTIAEKESRHEVLCQLNEEGEGLAQGSQALLKSEEFEFAGALAAQLDVSHEFVAAIEAALGGNGRVRTDSLLERKARIDAIGIELGQLKREQAMVEQQRVALESQIATATRALETAVALHQEAQLAQTASASKISQLEREQHSAERELESLEFERSTLERQIAAADAQIQQLEEQGAELEEKIARDRKEAALLQTQRDEALREEEEANVRLAELRIAAATHEQKHQNLLAQRAPMLARQTELSDVMATRRADIENYEARLVTQAAEDDSARNAIEQQRQECTRREAEIWKLVAERTSRLETINSDEGGLRAVRDRL